MDTPVTKPEDQKPEVKPENVKVEPPKMVGPLKTGTDAPQIGLGTTLTIASTVQVKVQSIKVPTWSGKDVDVTGMNDLYDTFIPGVPNNGEAEIDVLYMKSQQVALWALKNVTNTSFVVTFPDAGSRSWTGWINNITEEASVKDHISAKIKVRASGLVTIA
jgi:hypothetical protein